MTVLVLFKPIGKTPLEIVSEYKKNTKDVKKICYVGRLDPMACGKFIALTNNDCLNTNKYFNTNKRYKYEILIGVNTSSLDLLGLVCNVCSNKNINKEQIDLFFSKKYIGKIIQEYPKYSSYKINNKPLWWYAKNNIDVSPLPSKEIEIYSNQIISNNEISGRKLKKYVNENILQIKGDFNQSNILKSWEIIEDNMKFPILEIESHVSSGTFIRKICEKFGEYIGIPCCAYSINRIEINLFNNINE
jgi:tRNA pseudouridine(55) synthase